MKKNRFHFYVLGCLFAILLISSCQEPTVDNDDITRHIELIEVNGKIKTFPLTIVLSEHLTGDTFPAEVKLLSGFSRQFCKTLPISGLLRLGPNNYYSYNAISELNIPSSIENNEDAITKSIQQQVEAYLNKTKLNNFDSLLSPNSEESNIRALSLSYIRNTSDSIFFYSKSANAPGSIRIGNRTYNVYTNSGELRKKIDDIVCNGRGAISVLYDPPIFDLAPGTTGSNTSWPTRGGSAGDSCVGSLKFEKLHDGTGGFMIGKLIETNSKSCGFTLPSGRAGDTCVSGSRFERFHDGKGGFRLGKLLERNSRSCGFTFPTGPAGDTCMSGSRFARFHDGKGGFRIGKLLERNSRSCGFTFPTGVAGDTCVSGSKFQRLHNGKGGFMLGRLIERNSRSCGFNYPTGVAGDTCVSGSKYQRLHNGRGGFMLGKLIERNSSGCGYILPLGLYAGDTCINGSRFQKLHNGQRGFQIGKLIERNSKSCGFTPPAKGTTATGFICYKGSKYARLNDGQGGFSRGPVVEQNSKDCPVEGPDNRCVRRSTPLCEQDGGGNYTGRRVQYCYNSKGDIVQTIVIEKCDSDCRCIGK